MRLPGCWMHADRLKWYRVGIRHAEPDDRCGTKSFRLHGLHRRVLPFPWPPTCSRIPYLPGQLWETVGQTRGYECLRDAAFWLRTRHRENAPDKHRNRSCSGFPKVPLPPGPCQQSPMEGSHCHLSLIHILTDFSDGFGR